MKVDFRLHSAVFEDRQKRTEYKKYLNYIYIRVRPKGGNALYYDLDSSFI